MEQTRAKTPPANDLPNVIGHQVGHVAPPPPQAVSHSDQEFPMPPDSPTTRDLRAAVNESPPQSPDSLAQVTATRDTNQVSLSASVGDPLSVTGSLNATSLLGLASHTRDPGITDTSTSPPETAGSSRHGRSRNGVLEIGTNVEYFSDTLGRWIPAKVLGFKNGHYKLDRKPKAPQNKVRAIPGDTSGTDAVLRLLASPEGPEEHFPQAPPVVAPIVDVNSSRSPSPDETEPLRPKRGDPIGEMYEREEARLSSSLQESAFSRLKQWDVNRTGHFTANQVVHLVHEMAIARQAVDAIPKRKTAWEYFSCNKCIWIVLAMLIVWTPMLIAGSLSRPMLSENGVLTNKDGELAATAAVVEPHAIASLLSLPDETLRRMQECTFVHRYAFHRLQVSSVVRTAQGSLIVTSPHMSRLKIDRPSGADTRMVFSQDFVGDEIVNLNGECNFAFMAATAKR